MSPKEPGEIGWHANADSPDVDLSLPAPGSGGAKAEDMPETRPPTVAVEDTPAEEPVVEAVPEVVVESVPVEPQEEQPEPAE